MPILSNFPGGTGEGGGGIVLGSVSNITTLAASGKVYVKWTDPNDVVVSDAPLATWAGTLLVRKAGSAPMSRRDGTIVLDSTTRNQYSTGYFCDSGLTNGVTYYYKFFPYTTSKAYTDAEDNAFTATPTVQVTGIDSWKVTSMSASSEAGDGKMTVKWTDPAASITSDGVALATWASTTIVVKAGSYPTSKDDESAAYRLKVTTRNQYSSNALTVSGLTNGTKYYIGFYPETTDGGINTSTAQRTTGTANKITISNTPAQSNTLTYTGNAQFPAWSNYSTTQLTLGGTTSGTNAGSYNATFTPKTDYRWSDGATTAKTVAWSIGKANGSLSLSASSVTLNSDNKSGTVTVTRAGNGTITATSSNTSVATVSISGTTLTIKSVDDTTGTATITVKVAAGTNHKAPSDKTISVSAEFLPAIGTALDDCSWEDIRKIADQGLASKYWAIGATKTITINGKVGTLSVSNLSINVFILGYDHNSTHEGNNTIHFQIGKIGTTSVGLIDSGYGNYYTDGIKYFNMNHWGNYNYGGWAGCDVRYDVLGSTDQAPSGYGSAVTTSRKGYDASDTCATNPVSNTLMAALPSDLRAVMRGVTKYSDNTGNSSNVLANVTATKDFLFLLSEFEVQGARTYANQYEKNYQAQYQYYANGNSKVFYRHSATSSTAWWRLRSAAYATNYSFCNVTTDGGATNATARYAGALSPGFVV